MNIGIVGLGLIGGSMAKSIKAHTGHRVFGIDINDETMLFARICGAIDGELNDESLPICDVVFVAVTPNSASEWIKINAKKIAKGAIVTDLCGIKRAIYDAFSQCADEYGFSYVGGHPMAGKERGKFINATDSLFCGAPMILTPVKSDNPQVLETLEKLFGDIGFSRTVFTNPDEHDKIIAYTSQLAHITSSAYIKSPEAQRRRGFSAGSYEDMTRVAHLDENMWTELFIDNADYLSEQIEILITNLGEYLDAIKDKDKNRLCALLLDGREKKDKAGGC